MENKYTPGPWKFGRPGIGSDSRLIVWKEDNEGFTIAQIAEIFSGKNEEYNARLIVESPLMYESLSEIRLHCLTGLNWSRDMGQLMLDRAYRILRRVENRKENP